MYINSTNNAQNPLSPSELNQILARLLKSELNSFWLNGEVSDYFRSQAGHSYFNLKDKDASIRCVMFKQQSAMPIKYGQQIIVFGHLSMYAPRGTVQINVLKALDAGSGLLQQQFQQLKQKLEAAGLFEPSRKKKLPTIIDDVAIITSPEGAALRDILEVIKRKNPLLNITIYPTAVQGHTAVKDIMQALTQADRSNHQILLLTRGGGSQEDLWCFNDEQLAHLMADLNTPVLTAIGHERDVSIADLCADEVAITPTAAAERLSGQFLQQMHDLDKQSSYLDLLIQNNVRKNQQSVDGLAHRLQKQHPKTRLSQQHHQLNHLSHVLYRNLNDKLEKAKTGFINHRNKLIEQQPNIRELKNNLRHKRQLLNHFIQTQQQHSHNALNQQISRLDSLNPLSVLTRGYSYTTDENGRVITDSQQVKDEEIIATQLKSGKIHSKIVERFD